MSRLAALLVLVAAFAPAAVLGALPLVLLTTVSAGAVLTAVLLAVPRPQPVPVGTGGRPECDDRDDPRRLPGA